MRRTPRGRPRVPLLGWSEPPRREIATSATSTRQRNTSRTSAGFELGTVLKLGLGIASIAAGVLHLTAASAHEHHALIYAFFVGTGFLQIAWGTTVAVLRRPTPLLFLGALGSAGLIAVWAVSRVSGLPFVDGANHAEPIGVKDTVTVALELLVIAGAWVLVTHGTSRALSLRLPESSLAPLAAASILLIAPAAIVPAHEHSDAHMHGGGRGHGDGDHLDLAAGHGHGVAGDSAHAHGDDATAHTHVLGAHGDHESADVDSSHPHDASPPRGAAPAASAPEPATGIKASVRYGPFLLPPASAGGEAHYNRILSNVAKPCSDCYLVSAKPDLVYADGSRANLSTGAMLHHAVWTRPAIKDTTCGRNSAIGSQGMRFFASGNERTQMRLPAGFGYHVGNDSWNLIAEIMNHSDQARAVYITLDVLYRPASETLRNTTPVWMDMDNCGDSEYAVPAGKSNALWTWESTITGRVVSTGGHVHNGGVKTVLANETTKQEMCSSVAGYGTKPEFDGSIESMSICVWDRLGTVREGEKLGIRTYYNSSEAQYDVMGIMIAMVYETTDLNGGSPPPRNSGPQEQEPPPPSGGHDHP